MIHSLAKRFGSALLSLTVLYYAKETRDAILQINQYDKNRQAKEGQRPQAANALTEIDIIIKPYYDPFEDISYPMYFEITEKGTVINHPWYR